ncbi:condensation domain-containing protein, partial [Duganella sp. Root1480D1]|uniref:condensation domain-containing protein n=1 Tax=Duganella sp. Root1480D1 TaxID=1736471 RepID=UPI001E446660
MEFLRREYLRRKLAQTAAPETPLEQDAGIVAVERHGALPLSWSQLRLWFLARMNPAANAAYNMPVALRLHGKLDIDALRATLDRIVARHEILRTRFTMEGSTPVQMVEPEARFSLEVQDCSDIPPAGHVAAIAAANLDAVRTPFNLTAGPALRGRLLRLAEDEHVIFITLHHIVADGWSMGILVREVSVLYEAYSAGRADPLPPLAIQYGDFAAWQRKQGAALQRQLAFWRTHLEGAPELLALPTDRPRPAMQSFAGSRCLLKLDAPLTAGLRALAQRHGATLFMTLLAGWSLLLSRISGQDDVVVGMPVANRQRAELEPLIGFFVNTLALRVHCEAQESVEQMLARVKAGALAAFANQDVPFEQVVEALKPARTLAYNALFQAMFTMHSGSAEGEALRLPGLTLEGIEQPRESIHFDLHLTLSDAGDCLVGDLRATAWSAT